MSDTPNIASNITVAQFGRAMSQLDLSTVPPEKRADAILDHLGRIMSDTATNPGIRTRLHEARILRAHKRFA